MMRRHIGQKPSPMNKTGAAKLKLERASDVVEETPHWHGALELKLKLQSTPIVARTPAFFFVSTPSSNVVPQFFNPWMVISTAANYCLIAFCFQGLERNILFESIIKTKLSLASGTALLWVSVLQVHSPAPRGKRV